MSVPLCEYCGAIAEYVTIDGIDSKYVCDRAPMCKTETKSMKIWAKTKEFFEGKFLVIRRDGSVPAWPHFVLGARDPDAPAALIAYAAARASRTGEIDDYARSILDLADDFRKYRAKEGDGDPEAGPHRKDDPEVIHVMRGGNGPITAWQSTNKVK